MPIYRCRVTLALGRRRLLQMPWTSSKPNGENCPGHRWLVSAGHPASCSGQSGFHQGKRPYWEKRCNTIMHRCLAFTTREYMPCVVCLDRGDFSWCYFINSMPFSSGIANTVDRASSGSCCCAAVFLMAFLWRWKDSWAKFLGNFWGEGR